VVRASQLVTINRWTCISYTHTANKSPNSTCPSRILWVQVFARNEGQSYPFQRRNKTPSNQTATRASHGLEGPPEKGTDNTKTETQSNDKWAWRTAHTKKGKVGGPSGVVGRPAHGPHHLQAPHGYPLLVSYVGSRRNMPVSRLRRGWLPPYIYEGRGSILNHGGDGRSPSSLQATLENP